MILLLGAVGLPLQRASALPQSQAVWSVQCDLSHQAPDDPIVSPGQAGHAHLHDFFGNVSTDADATTASLARAASSCRNGMDEVDKAAYWTPALLRNGRPVAGASEHRINAYYAVLDKPLPVRPIPLGLRMIAGDATATTAQSTRIVHYNCIRSPGGGQVTGDSAAMPSCPGGSYLSAKITFPGCWDGVRLDSPDHKSHMAYPTRQTCPVTHPVRLPTVMIRLRWRSAEAIPASQLSLSSGGQHSMHADFWNVWSPSVMAWLVDNCLNSTRNCRDIPRSQIDAPTGSFTSGDGQASAASGTGGGASTATQPASTPATARPRGQVAAAANDSVAADGGAAPQPGDDNDGDVLAVTGPSETRLPLGAGLLLVVGIAIVAVARYRPRHVRR